MVIKINNIVPISPIKKNNNFLIKFFTWWFKKYSSFNKLSITNDITVNANMKPVDQWTNEESKKRIPKNNFSTNESVDLMRRRLLIAIANAVNILTLFWDPTAKKTEPIIIASNKKLSFVPEILRYLFNEINNMNTHR